MATVAIVILCVVFVFFALVLGVWVFGERGHLLLPSTLRMVRQPSAKREVPPLRCDAVGMTADENAAAGAKTNVALPPGGPPPVRQKFGILKQLEAYVYGRWTNQYISVLLHRIVPRLDAEGRKKLANQYHGKVLTHDEAKALIQINQPIRRDLEQIIPYPIARDLILNAPVQVAAYECACRHARENPCQPTQVCMVVGDSPVQFVLEHNPKSSRRLTQEEALEMLRAEHERGHLHSAWFKDAMQGRFYAICNCCKCCCGGIEQMKKYGMPTVVSSGYVASVDADLCNACGNCEQMCPFDALSVNGCATLEWEKCMGCGVCVDQCVTGAVSLVRDERKGVPLDVREFAA